MRVASVPIAKKRGCYKAPFSLSYTSVPTGINKISNPQFAREPCAQGSATRPFSAMHIAIDVDAALRFRCEQAPGATMSHTRAKAPHVGT